MVAPKHPAREHARSRAQMQRNAAAQAIVTYRVYTGFAPTGAGSEAHEELAALLLALRHHAHGAVLDYDAADNDAQWIWDDERTVYRKGRTWVEARATHGPLDIPVLWDQDPERPSDSPAVKVSRTTLEMISEEYGTDPIPGTAPAGTGGGYGLRFLLDEADTVRVSRHDPDGAHAWHVDLAPDERGAYEFGRGCWTWHVTAV